MSRAVALVLVLLFMLLARFAFDEAVTFDDALPTLTFGFLMLAAYLVGDVLAQFKIPKITGYIVAGVLLGPEVSGFVTAETVSELKLIDELALSFIALAAGGELRLSELRPRARSVMLTLLFTAVLVLPGVAAFVAVARPLLPFLKAGATSELFAVAGIMGAFALARSPSSAIAIINECRARGPFTETVLGVTVVMDLLVIMLFAIVVSFSLVLVNPAATADYAFLLVVAAELVASIVVGIAVGGIISFYIRAVKADLLVFILGIAFMIAFFSHQLGALLETFYGLSLHLEPMLISVTAGFWVQNFSQGGSTFMDRIGRSSLPIYVIFFSLTGAALEVGALRHTWLIASLLVVVRFTLIWLASYAGAALAGDPPAFRRLAGLSYVTQAGVSLGLAGIVVRRFPEWGGALATVMVAVITLNQLIGPILLEYALTAVGEARIRPGRRSS
ncbi:MAG: cation:proton antiporter [Deltaproteobacteria bacterium]|nr:cation:proton antiporter [Deltaproteobacteria bacterium]MBW2667018.1 cation:proton antiporter [Deltaproteobacteria bacterium]